MDKGQSRKMNAISLSGGLPGLAKAWASVQAVAPLRPIHNEADYDNAVALADGLADIIGDNENHPLFSLLDFVTDVISAWEKEHIKIPDAAPREVLRHLIDANNLKYKDLEDIASQTLLSDILSGRRNISKKVAKALAERFHVGVGAFV